MTKRTKITLTLTEEEVADIIKNHVRNTLSTPIPSTAELNVDFKFGVKYDSYWDSGTTILGEVLVTVEN